jgi:two-component system LytT family response regulator
MKKIQVIVIDDERSCREELKRMLTPYADIELVGEAANAGEAAIQIAQHQPDLIFLDIQLPGPSGFELLESLPAVPAVLFTTAFDQYAVRAFELNALDYLVKPIRDERFASAMEKVRHSMAAKAALANSHANRQLFIKDGEQCHFISVGDICLIESLDNYSRLYAGNKKIVLKRSLNQWEAMLPADQFFRISRTHLINTGYIQQIHNLPKGKISIQLTTGQLLEASARQSVKFKNDNRL